MLHISLSESNFNSHLLQVTMTQILLLLFYLPPQKSKRPLTSQLSPKKLGRMQLFDNNFVLSLDIAKLSDRKATVVLITTLQSVSYDPLKYNFNHSSIRRQRINFRQKIATSLKCEFKAEMSLTIY